MNNSKLLTKKREKENETKERQAKNRFQASELNVVFKDFNATTFNATTS